jgi:opacity protein-like surface antigen
MRMVIRSIPAAALALCLAAAHLTAQQPGHGNFQWYLGGQGGVMVFDTPTQDRSGIPTFGGQTLIVAKRTGLMLSFEEGVGSDETSSYNDANGVQNVTFNDIRKYSAVLMAFPIKAAVQPYLGVGYGIIHVVNPTPTSPAAFQSDAVELGSSGFGTFVGGLTFQVGRLMAFGQYQITSSPSSHSVTDGSGTVVAVGHLLDGPTHTFSGGLRIGLGSSKDGTRSAGGY